MKFPRNARILRSQLDMAPFAGVFFLLVIFLMLASLIYTPGVRLELPVGNDLPGLDRPMVAVALDSSGRLFYRNQVIDESALEARLREAVKAAAEPLTLVVQADKTVRYDQLIHLTLLARNAGVAQAWLATLPQPFAAPGPNRQIAP
jgi:biopolymer transport protein ExbD